MDSEAFKEKMKNDEAARAEFVADIQKALAKQGVNVQDAEVMKKLGFKPGNPKDLSNVASTAVITIVM